MTHRGFCAVPNCGSPIDYRDWCDKHYQRWLKHGDPTVTKLEWDPIVRLKRDVAYTASGCWIYNGKDPCSSGYQRWYVGGKRYLVHRWTYEHFVGPIPDGHQIDHLCRVPPCCNPEHLRPLTPRQNALLSPTAAPAVNARKTHCKRGHLFDKTNTRIERNGARQCRACINERARRRRAAKRAA